MDKNRSMENFRLSCSEQEFRETKALSYSKIASYDKDGPISLITKKDLDGKSYIIFGKLVDDMLLSPQNLYKYKINNYNGELPSGSISEIINKCVDFINKTGEQLTDNIILEFFAQKDFYKTWKPATKVAAIWKYKDYLDFILQNKDSILITPFMWTTAEKIVETIKTSPKTQQWFNLLEGQEGFNQVDLITEYNGSKVKGAFDRLVVDHINKTFQIIDLKTGSVKSDEFVDQFWKFRYWIQATLYYKMLEEIIKNDDQYQDYEILDFVFVYMPSTGATIPTVLTVEKDRISAFENGFYIGRSEYKQKGIKQLIKEIEWHYESQIFDVSYDFINKEGCYIINDKQVRGEDE